MSSKMPIPTFATEEEEVAWLNENRHLVENEIGLAFKEGRMRRGPLAPPSSKDVETTTVHLNVAESTRARALAAEQHIEYEAYLQH